MTGERRDILLGPWNSPESKAEYRRVLPEPDANDGATSLRVGPAPTDLTVNEVLQQSWQRAEKHYGTAPGIWCHRR